MRNLPTVSIIIPAYNESENLPHLLKLIKTQLENCLLPKETFEILIIDDGSADATPKTLLALRRTDKRIHFLRLSRNFGHQSALKAGLDYASGKCVISMDADLQHPPKLLATMIKAWRKGIQVVYTVRSDPKETGTVKKMTSIFFYQLFRFISGIPLEPGAADFRLLDRKVVDVVRSMGESVLFLRGIIAWVGFSSKAIPYVASPRYKGVSHYSFTKMLQLAIGGITSFSVRPLYLTVILGLFLSLFSGLYGLYAVGIYVFEGRLVLAGWASIITSVLFIGGVQLILLGVLGIYIGNIYIESKKRPLYIIDQSTLSKSRGIL